MDPRILLLYHHDYIEVLITVYEEVYKTIENK